MIRSDAARFVQRVASFWSIAPRVAAECNYEPHGWGGDTGVIVGVLRPPFMSRMRVSDSYWLLTLEPCAS